VVVGPVDRGITLESHVVEPVFQTTLGRLYQGDCLNVLPEINASSIDVIFADPPFNLNKHYGSLSRDSLGDQGYLDWCHRWIDECCRVLRPGGSFFLYNLPRWNTHLSCYLETKGLLFRHWIAVAIAYGLPRPGRLYPAHYSLLYHTKGKPATFRCVRTPIQRCRHCKGEIKNYGGHRDKIHPHGVNLRDVWDDIPPVRHRRFKDMDERPANQVSTTLVRRSVEVTSYPGQVVLDPFLGSGTTAAVCEATSRRWMGIELEDTGPVVKRLTEKSVVPHVYTDHVEPDQRKRPPLPPSRNGS
jgi:site-specific DNA-methyltransferase (adenine-specific)